MKKRCTHIARRGFLTVDLVLALIVVAMLTMALATLSWHYQKGRQRIEHQRHALRLLEQAMTQLQTAGEITVSQKRADFSIEMLEDEAPAGTRWIRLRVQYIDTKAQLVGLVHASVAEGSGT